LTEEANRARQRGDRGLNGLAHVAEDQVASGTSGVNGLVDGGLEQGRSRLHVSRGVVADGVGGRWDEFVAIRGRGGGDHGGTVVRGGELILLDEASNGRHFIIRA